MPKKPFNLIQFIRKFFFSFSMIIVLTILGIYFLDLRIEKSTEPFVYDDLYDIPHNQVGLLLGTSKQLRNGHTNLYFKYRIDAAVRLYKANKINFILVSGDNSLKSYNEPRDMMKALIERGIPQEVIYLDYAGFRTLDSVVRSNKIFGQKRMTVISQKFHNSRAIYIAQHHGIDAIGFNAQDVTLSSGFKTQLREKLARVKAFLDLYLLNKQPKFLGERIKIG